MPEHSKNENTLKILWVDDNPDNLTLVKRVLGAEDIDVDLASTAEVALRKVGQQKYNLVVLDISLPGIDGYEVLRRMKIMPEMEGVKFVINTANVMKGDREKALDAGADAYIPKPIDVDELPNRISAILAQGERR